MRTFTMAILTLWTAAIIVPLETYTQPDILMCIFLVAGIAMSIAQDIKELTRK